MEFLWDAIIRIGIISSSFFTGTNPIPENEVPSVVRNTFGKEFPETVEVEWEKKPDSFEVVFEVENVEYSALFDKSGRMLMHKKVIALEALPAAVKEKLRTYFTNNQIEEIGIVEKEGVKYFQIEIEGKVREQKVVYTADGQLTEKIPYWD